MKKFRLIPIICAALLLISGCGGEDAPGPVSDTSTAQPSVQTQSPEIYEGDIQTTESVSVGEFHDYTIIRAEGNTGIVPKLTSILRKALVERGYTPQIATDWHKSLDEAGEAALSLEYEILIGSTNRPESSSIGSLEYDEYLIRQVGHKIVVAGGSDYALEAACTELAGLVEIAEGDDGGIALPKSEISGRVTLPEYNVIVTDQRNSRVLIINLALGELSYKNAIKSYGYDVYNIADARLRTWQGKTVVLAAYGQNRAKIVDYETGDTIWYTMSAANNPHACELLPNGVVAVASSTGGEIRFFNISGGTNQIGSTPLPDAHGLLYDPELDCLWAIGEDQLIAYNVRLQSGVVSVTERERYTIPTTGAHDLQPVWGDHSMLWITTVYGVYNFSKSNKSFSTDYDSANNVNIFNVKGIASFGDGSVAYVTPEGQFVSWTTESIHLWRKLDGSFYEYRLSSSTFGIYKIHTADPSYN